MCRVAQEQRLLGWHAMLRVGNGHAASTFAGEAASGSGLCCGCWRLVPRPLQRQQKAGSFVDLGLTF